jgi:hypothetical protein
MHAPEKEKAVPLARLSPVWPPREPPRPWEIGRGRVWLTALALFLILYFAVPAFFRWPHVISSWGGRYFIHRTVIPVPPLQQNDPHWSDELLGNTIETLGQAGCAVTSAAMVLHAYGVNTDPSRLNAFLIRHEGYVGDGLLDWDRVSGITGEQVQKAYEDYASYALIDAQILRGNPVIVRLHLHNGTIHFVVIVGKQGWDYLIRDPARPASYGVYPLDQLTSRIEALRYYTIVPPPTVVPKQVQAPLASIPATNALGPAPGVPSTPSAIAVPGLTTTPAVPPAVSPTSTNSPGSP